MTDHPREEGAERSRRQGPKKEPGAGYYTGETQVYCSRCRKQKRLRLFYAGQPSYRPKDCPDVCIACSEDPILPTEDEIEDFPALLPAHRIALQTIFKPGGNYNSAAQASGLSRQHISDMLAGKFAPDFRKAFRMLLTLDGLDMATISKELVKHTLESTQQQWNPAEKDWSEFPDHKNRLNALKHVTKLMAMEPDYQGGVTAAGIQVNINTNVGTNEEIEASESPGTFIVEAKKP